LLSNKIYPYEMSKMVTRHVNEFIKNDLYQSIYFILFYVLALRYNLMFFELFYPLTLYSKIICIILYSLKGNEYHEISYIK
jgi:hypothetical protein